MNYDIEKKRPNITYGKKEVLIPIRPSLIGSGWAAPAFGRTTGPSSVLTTAGSTVDCNGVVVPRFDVGSTVCSADVITGSVVVVVPVTGPWWLLSVDSRGVSVVRGTLPAVVVGPTAGVSSCRVDILD